MTAYAIFIQERTRNADELRTYAEMLRPLLGRSGGTVLAAHGPQDILEGSAPEGTVLVSFPSMEAARAFYDSPEYQAAVKHRFLGADYRSFIIGGFNWFRSIADPDYDQTLDGLSGADMVSSEPTVSKDFSAIADKDFRTRTRTSAKLLSSLANETRLRTIYLLASRGEMFVGELAAEIGISQSALSQHLGKLREAGIIATRRDAQKHYYSVQHGWTLDLLAALDAVYAPSLP